MLNSGKETIHFQGSSLWACLKILCSKEPFKHKPGEWTSKKSPATKGINTPAQAHCANQPLSEANPALPFDRPRIVGQCHVGILSWSGNCASYFRPCVAVAGAGNSLQATPKGFLSSENSLQTSKGCHSEPLLGEPFSKAPTSEKSRKKTEGTSKDRSGG